MCYKRGEGVRKYWILPLRNFWMAPKNTHASYLTVICFVVHLFSLPACQRQPYYFLLDKYEKNVGISYVLFVYIRSNKIIYLPTQWESYTIVLYLPHASVLLYMQCQLYKQNCESSSIILLVVSFRSLWLCSYSIVLFDICS